MTLDERHSAYLDGELDLHEREAVERELAADPALAADFSSLADVRAMVRGAKLAVPPGMGERIVAAVAEADRDGGSDAEPVRGHTVVPLRSRARVLAAVAAAVVIIVGVVGGLGGSTTIPAVGDLVRQHQAAAAGAEQGAMDAEIVDDTMMVDAPGMGDMAMMHVEMMSDDTAHFVYEASDGSLISVFRQDGETDLDALSDEMGKGDMAEMDGHSMWAADVDASHVAVLDGDGYIWTIVTVAGYDMSPDMLTGLPERDRSWWERLIDLVRFGR